MKILQILVLGGALAYSPVMLADSSSFDAGRLGRMKGILDVCSRVQPQEATRLLLQMKAVIGDATKQTVEQAAFTEEYQQAYQSVTTELGNMGQDEIAQACNGYLATAN